MPLKESDKEELAKYLSDPIWRMNTLYEIRTKAPGYEGKTVLFKPNNVQKKIYKSIEENPRTIILKPRKLGCTTGIVLYLLDQAMYNPNQLCRSIAHRRLSVQEIFNDTVQFAYKKLRDSYPDLCPKAEYTTRAELQFLDNGSKYSIDVEARGVTPTKLHLSEVAYQEDEAMLQDTLASLSPTAKGIAESTAHGKANWFEETFTKNWELKRSGREPEWNPLFFSWFDDPMNRLPVKKDTRLYYREDCREQHAKYRNADGSELDGMQLLFWDRQRFAYGDRLPELFPANPEEAFMFSTGRVYSEFSRIVHVIPPTRYKDYEISMDYGQQNPMVFLLSHQDYDNNFIFFREFYRPNSNIEEARKWLEQNAPEKIDSDGFIHIKYPDPSVFKEDQYSSIATPGKQISHRASIADEFQRHKILLYRGTQNDVQAGIARVKEYLRFDPDHKHPFRRMANGDPQRGSARVFFTEDMTNTISEFSNYLWPSNPKGQLNRQAYENPRKEHDHCLLSSTLVDTTLGQKTIESLVGKTGFVYTRDGGIERFFNVRKTMDDATVYRVSFSDGRSVTCTGDHRFLSADGSWKFALDLCSEDWIQCSTYASYRYQQDRPKICSKALLSLRFLFQKNGRQVTTTQSCVGEKLSEKDPKGDACPSQRFQQTQQPAGESGVTDSETAQNIPCRTFDGSTTKEAGRQRNSQCHAEGKSLAQFSRGKKMAPETCEGNEKEKASGHLHSLWKRLSDYATDSFKVLRRDMPSQGACAKVESVRKADTGVATYTLSVENTHCYSVNGGIIVKNSMDCVRYRLFTSGLPLQEILSHSFERGTVGSMVQSHLDSELHREEGGEAY